MALGSPGRRNDPLHVTAMALALVLAAFVGAALGLAWHALGSDEAEVPEGAGEGEGS